MLIYYTNEKGEAKEKVRKTRQSARRERTSNKKKGLKIRMLSSLQRNVHVGRDFNATSLSEVWR